MSDRHRIEWDNPVFFDEAHQEDAERVQIALDHGARDSINWYDVMHGHIDISPWLDETAYVFTILRDPVARVLSQFRDFQRLAPHDYSHKTEEAVSIHEACRLLPFHEVAARFKDMRFFQYVFEDGQCRVLTQSSVPFSQFLSLSQEERAAAAWERIEQRCARVGLQEQLEELLNRVALDLGLAPLQRMARINVTENTGESEADRAAAESLTQGDRLLVRRAAEHIRAQAAEDPPYGATEFERDIVARRVQVLSPVQIGREQVFDMNMPVIGWGFSGRDATNTAECSSWIGPDGDAALYFPVPGFAGVRGVMRLYVKGWAHEDLRGETTYLIDGVLAEPVSEGRPGVWEILRFEVLTRRSWMKVEIRGQGTLTDRQAGRDTGDPRRKLLNLWRYSFEPM